jgi:capsular polysaccharide transport system permease protein
MSTEAIGGGGAGAPPSEFARAGRALLVQWRVFKAVFLREAGVRRGQAYGLGWLLGSLEPLMMIAALGLLFYINSRAPPYGSNTLLFLANGVFPLYVVLYTSVRVRGPASQLSTGRFPLEMPLDEILAQALLHLLSTIITAVAFFAGMAFYGVREAIPHDLGALVGSIFFLFLLGLGVGVFNAAIARIFPFWSILWSGVVRCVYHFSGLYYVIDYFAPRSRLIYAANPITYGINWFRHAFYSFFPDTLSDPSYLIICALSAIVIGFSLERVFRREYMRGERFR